MSFHGYLRNSSKFINSHKFQNLSVLSFDLVWFLNQEARLAEAKAAKAAKEAKEAKEKRAREAAEQLRRDKATDASSSNKRSPPSSSDEEKEKEKRKRRRIFFLFGMDWSLKYDGKWWIWWTLQMYQFDLLRRKYNFVCYEGDEVVPRNSALLDLKSGWIWE